MRDILTGLAIIVIVALTTALVAPYFVDWNSQRGLLEKQISRTLGQKVTIGGNIDLKLLPAPYLVLDQTVIGADDGPITLGIRHLDLELAVAPLFRGEFEVVEAQLEEPTIRVTLQPDRSLPALPDAPAFKADVRFDRISVSDGTLAIADPQSGRTFVLDHLDLSAEAPSLAGPFKGTGALGAPGTRTAFRLSTTEAQGERTHAHLSVDETLKHAALDLDGDVILQRRGDSVRQSFAGTLAASGHLFAKSDTPIAWKLTGPVKASADAARLETGELRLGSEDAGLTLKAESTAQFGAAPQLLLALSAKQLDIDRIAGPPGDKKPPPPKLPELSILRRMIDGAAPPLPTVVSLAVENATYAGETLGNLKAEFGIGGAKPADLALSGDGPGGAHLDVKGTLAGNAPRGFDGRIDFTADSLPRALEWWSSVAPSAGIKASDLPFQSVKLASRVGSHGGRTDFADLVIDLGGSALKGQATVTMTEADKPLSVNAILSAQSLDLEALPDLTALHRSAAAFDLDLRLAANALRISNVGDSALSTGRLQLGLVTKNGEIGVKQLSIRDLGGATIDATARLGAKETTLAVKLDAARLDGTADLLRRVAPGDLAEAVATRASTLAPARLQIDTKLAATDKGGLRPVRVVAAGQLGATKIDVSLVPDADRSDVISLDATAEAPEGGALLRQLGLSVLPVDKLGPSRIILTAHGTTDQPLDTNTQITAGATRLDVTGRFNLHDAAQSAANLLGSGTASLRSPDLAPLLRSLGIAFPDLAGVLPMKMAGRFTSERSGLALDDLKGDINGVKVAGTLRWDTKTVDRPSMTGALDVERLDLSTLLGLALGPEQQAAPNAKWSNQAFGPGLVDPPQTNVTLKSKTLKLLDGLVADGVSVRLGIAPNVVTLKNLNGKIGAGELAADLRLRRDGAQATIEGAVYAEKVAVDLPALKTILSGRLELAGGGQSALALVSSLAGSGEATFADAVVPSADPKALPKIFDDVENDVLAVDDDSVVRALDNVATGSLEAGTRTFAASLASGTLTLDPKAPDAKAPNARPSGADPVTSVLSAGIDLRRLRFDERIRQTLHALPKNWSGAEPSLGITISGPFRAPRRFWDVSSFINIVAARAIARENARIEAYEFDIRERALFNQRLQSERRRELDRVKAEADAKAAEEAARRAEEEARRAEAERQERERQDRQRQEEAPPQSGSPTAPPAAAEPQSPPPRFQAPDPSTDPSAAGRY